MSPFRYRYNLSGLENVHVNDTRGPWSLCKKLFIEALKFILTVVVKYVWFNGV